ncbi:bifunctional riboflavin kinase/FAD synthetase [bacterium]|nr:bifunctional riboflavin kinase/FAD synthetase [candidate division CSSED10-310 bacterium]
MEVLRDPKPVPKEWSSAIVTIGNFDGVHIGHQRILISMVETAARTSENCTVITFDPHPLSILRPEREFQLIMTLQDRLDHLAAQGIERVVIYSFTPRLAMLNPTEFLTKMQAEFKPKTIYIGHDFRFGHGRSGDYSFLQRAGRQAGFTVERIPAISLQGQVVHSSVIRSHIRQGNLDAARRMLDRPHFLRGMVEIDRGVGRTLGYPTANLKLGDVVLPPDGVYATFASWGSHRRRALTYIGMRPTFGGRERVCESYLLDSAEDLYGAEMKVEFMAFLREDRSFASSEALVEQIDKDLQHGLEVFAEMSENTLTI